jgi:hypothetical protein
MSRVDSHRAQALTTSPETLPFAVKLDRFGSPMESTELLV